jgi:hypothetical protein
LQTSLVLFWPDGGIDGICRTNPDSYARAGMQEDRDLGMLITIHHTGILFSICQEKVRMSPAEACAAKIDFGEQILVCGATLAAQMPALFCQKSCLTRIFNIAVFGFKE